MGGDIKILYNSETKEYDIKYANGDLFRENGMTTALLMSLFTDRRANDDDVLPNPEDKRGWWGDLLETDGDKIGSRLWLLSGKKDQSALNFTYDAIKEAVQWFVNDGLWQKFNISVEYIGSILAFQLDAYYANGQKTSYMFKGLWENEMSLTII